MPVASNNFDNSTADWTAEVDVGFGASSLRPRPERSYVRWRTKGVRRRERGG
jgi:hypothetical protein